MKAAIVGMLAGVLWVAAPAGGGSAAELPLADPGFTPAAHDPWFATPGACACDPCRSPGLWAGCCAERAAHYAHWRRFWQKVHCGITLGWLPKLHRCHAGCCQEVPLAPIPEQVEEPVPEQVEESQPQAPVPPPPAQADGTARTPARLPLLSQVAARPQAPVLRGSRPSWVRASGAAEEKRSWFRIRLPGWSLPKWWKKPSAG